MYFVSFAIAFACFGFHTLVHLLGHFRKIEEGRKIHMAIGASMFFAWFSFFFMSFSGYDPMPMSTGFLSYAGLPALAAGFALFLVSHSRVHKRMHGGKGGLVTDGVYRHIRHPMYLGEILMLLGGPVLGQAGLTLLLSFIFIGQILIWRHLEEQQLMREFPGYKDYMKKTWF